MALSLSNGPVYLLFHRVGRFRLSPGVQSVVC
jgi:hypothetical protein